MTEVRGADDEAALSHDQSALHHDDASARIVIATRNAGKIRELRGLLHAAGFASDDLASLGIAEDPAEDALEVFDTFEQNAAAKARWFARLLPGRTVIADDSGLEVLALSGAPGVRSKRFSGSSRTGAALDKANNAALQHALRDVAERRARYVCVAVCVQGERTWSARGECAGVILDAPRGMGGFGYDPYFLSDELQRTFAEAGEAEKARVSHRGRAVREVLRGLARAGRGVV